MLISLLIYNRWKEEKNNTFELCFSFRLKLVFSLINRHILFTSYRQCWYELVVITFTFGDDRNENDLSFETRRKVLSKKKKPKPKPQTHIKVARKNNNKFLTGTPERQLIKTQREKRKLNNTDKWISLTVPIPKYLCRNANEANATCKYRHQSQFQWLSFWFAGWFCGGYNVFYFIFISKKREITF